MKNKTFYILISGLISVIALGVFYSGHRTIPVNSIIYGPDFASPMPFRAFTADKCSPADMTIPDEYTCVVKLTNATVAEANTLADKLVASQYDTSGDVSDTHICVSLDGVSSLSRRIIPGRIHPSAKYGSLIYTCL